MMDYSWASRGMPYLSALFRDFYCRVLSYRIISASAKDLISFFFAFSLSFPRTFVIKPCIYARGVFEMPCQNSCRSKLEKS